MTDSETTLVIRAAQGALQDAKEKIVMATRVSKNRGIWGVSGRLSRHMSKPRVLAITRTTDSGQRIKGNLHILKYSSGGSLQPAKFYKLKHLVKVEVLPSDITGCTFTLGFDNLKSQSVAPSQWTMRNTDERNRFFISLLKTSKELVGRIPKFTGMDVVEMALWAQANTKTAPVTASVEDTPAVDDDSPRDLAVTVEEDLLVSQAEEDDIEALLGTYLMGIDEAEAFSERLKRELQALEAANVYSILESEPLVDEVLQRLDTAMICVEDMDEWLGIFNLKLRHMREDIESIESRNNQMEMQSVNNKALIEELNKLLERLHIPSEYASLLTGGVFDEAKMLKNIEACDWLAGALRSLEPPLLDPIYANMLAVKEKRAELEKLKSTFVRRASEFLRTYFSSLVEFMVEDKSYFSQRGQLKRPDHADLRYKCRTYARLLQHLKSLDKSCLGPLRSAYCKSLNYLLRREAREFANELRASTKASRNQTAWLEGSGGSGTGSNSDNAAVSEAYAKMLTIFIPLLVDESSFFASFMCFDVLPLVPAGVPSVKDESNIDDNDDLSPMDLEGNDVKDGQNSAELEALNVALQELLDGIQEDFYAVVDWAYKVDPLRCISMHGITDRYLSGQKADAAGFVRRLLGDLQMRITLQFNRFVDEACHQIERNDRNMKQVGILSYIPRFSTLAARMEQYIQGQSRELVDQAYTKLVGTMFTTLERVAQIDPKHTDIVLLENYAAFQNSLYDLANVVPTLAKFYHQASEAYEQACTRYTNSIINYQFDKLFQFAQKVENLMYTITPEEVPFQLGLSKMDLRKMLKSSLSGVEKSFQVMYKRMQKNLTSEELLPSLWDKCKADFIEKYESFEALIAKCYPNETISPSSAEIKEMFKGS
eukprot:TRINITY_DN14932_c0_g1_i1.p1 TRINITY_DN14932_c0_g1~~TRINITY_DN14932_c0_g1_i1.p1  ORF type:complete len:883 (+),score=188.57 TRINITY_DN14932_c0_g1_i1:136-2784(+)